MTRRSTSSASTGHAGTILNSATPLRDEAGQITGAIWVLQDISERKCIETERKRLLAEMDATLASIADGLVIYAPDGTVLRANEPRPGSSWGRG